MKFTFFSYFSQSPLITVHHHAARSHLPRCFARERFSERWQRRPRPRRWWRSGLQGQRKRRPRCTSPVRACQARATTPYLPCYIAYLRGNGQLPFLPLCQAFACKLGGGCRQLKICTFRLFSHREQRHFLDHRPRWHDERHPVPSGAARRAGSARRLHI